MKTFKGYNGLPDLSTFDFVNVGERGSVLYDNEWSGQTCYDMLYRGNVYRLVNKGSVANMYEFGKNHPDLLSQIDIDDPTTWIDAWSGIKICQIRGNQLDGFTFVFYIADLYTNFVDDLHEEDCYITFTANFPIPTPSLPPRIMNAELALAYFDVNYAPYPESGQEWSDNPYARDSFKFISSPTLTWSTQNNNLIYPIPYFATQDVNNITQQQILVPSYLEMSTDDRATWYINTIISQSDLYFAYAGRFVTSWGGVPIDEDNDHSYPAGGGGNYGREPSEEVPFDGIPTVTAVTSGFIRIYHPSISQLHDITDFMYSSNFLDNLTKLIDNPIDYIIALMMNPATPNDGTPENIKIGGLVADKYVTPITGQYKTFDCGSINIEECYGSFLDYDNFTQVSMFLPFCGLMKLDCNLVMHSTITLKYVVDFLTGDCVARVIVTNNHGINNVEVYNKDGNCACHIPMSGSNYMSLIKGVANIAVGGLSAIGGNVGGGISAVASGVSSMKIEHDRVGSVSGQHGIIGSYIPYIMIERPQQSLAENYNLLEGRPSNLGGKVKDFKGFTTISDIKLNGIDASENELVEIRNLLESGVYI